MDVDTYLTRIVYALVGFSGGWVVVASTPWEYTMIAFILCVALGLSWSLRDDNPNNRR